MRRTARQLVAMVVHGEAILGADKPAEHVAMELNVTSSTVERWMEGHPCVLYQEQLRFLCEKQAQQGAFIGRAIAATKASEPKLVVEPLIAANRSLLERIRVRVAGWGLPW
ncbi:MAG: hypothetical protein KAJ19_08970 [Gammaproteobacteria bacterium]|nr:hypothetical protein [Gammaproteobacteria bacterium]